MKRYYVCKIIGDGSSPENAYRPAVADYGVSSVQTIAQNADGTLKRAWALVLVDTVDHAKLIADPRIKAIPDAALDNTFGSLSAPVKSAVRSFLAAEGIDDAWIKPGTLIRQIIRYLGQQHEANFDENNFDVG